MTSQDKKDKDPSRSNPKRGHTIPSGKGKPKGKNSTKGGTDDGNDATSTTPSHQDEQRNTPARKPPPASNKSSPQSQASNKSDTKSQASGKTSAKQGSQSKSATTDTSTSTPPRTSTGKPQVPSAKPPKKPQNVDKVKAPIHSDQHDSTIKKILPRPKTPNVDKDNAHVHSNSSDGSDLSSDDMSVKHVTVPTKMMIVTSNDRGQQRGSNTGTQEPSVPTVDENSSKPSTIGASTSTPRQTVKSTRFLGSLLGQAGKNAGKMIDSAKNRLTPAVRRPMIYESLRKRSGSEDSITSLRGLLSSWNSNPSKDERDPPQTDSPSSGKPIDLREIFRGNSFPEPNHNDNDLQFNSPGIEESDVNSDQFSYNENNFVDTPSPSSRHEDDTTYVPTDESQEPTVLPDPSTSDPRDSTIEPEDTEVDLRELGTFPDLRH